MQECSPTSSVGESSGWCQGCLVFQQRYLAELQLALRFSHCDGKGATVAAAGVMTRKSDPFCTIFCMFFNKLLTTKKNRKISLLAEETFQCWSRRVRASVDDSLREHTQRGWGGGMQEYDALLTTKLSGFDSRIVTNRLEFSCQTVRTPLCRTSGLVLLLCS